MAEVKDLKQNLDQAMQLLRDAVNTSIELRAQSSETKAEVIHLWEAFMGEFFGYIKHRSKEAKDNLLAGISWTRLKIF